LEDLFLGPFREFLGPNRDLSVSLKN